jgi:hypothetical protein
MKGLSVPSLQEVVQKTVEVGLVLPVGRQVKTSEPVVPDNKAPVTEHKTGPVQIDSSSENAFQEVFLAGCSTDVFFPEQCSDDTAQDNGNNLAKSSSRWVHLAICVARYLIYKSSHHLF